MKIDQNVMSLTSRQLTNIKAPKIAVILAFYNGMCWIDEQLDSILNQQYAEITVFISVDTSIDENKEFCILLFKQYTNIITLPCVGRFGGSAKNFFRLSRDVNFTNFDYISFADQDDIWDANKLSSAIVLIKQKKTDAYSSNVTAFWADGKTMLIDKAQNQCQFDYMFESAGPGCTFVLTQKLALHLQKFLIQNRQACEYVELHDWFIYAFARTNGYKWVIDKQALMQYRQHETNVVGANVGLKAKLSRWNKLREGWLKNQAILLADIIGYSDSWIIKRLKRNNPIDKIILIINIRKFRRKPIDRFVLALSILVGIKK